MSEIKVGVISLGCAKNLVDTEVMLGILKEAGFKITGQPEKAEVLIINTCGFINDAKEESINTIIEMGQYKKRGNCKVLIGTGCLTQRYGKELLKEMPELDGVVGTGDYPDIVEVINGALAGLKVIHMSDSKFLYDHTSPRVLSGPPHRAYVKIAEGCSHRCAFCVIPRLWGDYRSREPLSIIKEVEELAAKGVKEINLIAQDTTGYGKDLKDKAVNLPSLLRDLVKIKDISWIRVLYGYPDGITGDLIRVMASEEKICKYLDLPLQHAHPYILKKMRRPFNKEKIKDMISTLRAEISGIILRSSFIVGFPGEKEFHFKELYNFLNEVKFDRVGVFIYSREEDTPAAQFKGQIKEKLKVKRYQSLMTLQKRISREKNEAYKGSILEVLVEGKLQNSYFGRFYGQAPEVDGLVYFKSIYPLNTGQFVKVKINAAGYYDLRGEVMYELS